MTASLNVFIGVLIVATGFCLARLLAGPSLADRTVAIDTLMLNLIGLVSLTAIRFGTSAYFMLVVVFALFGFVGALCIAKYLGGSDLFD